MPPQQDTSPRAALQQLVDRQLDHGLLDQLQRFQPLGGRDGATVPVHREGPATRCGSLDEVLEGSVGADNPVTAVMFPTTVGAFGPWAAPALADDA